MKIFAGANTIILLLIGMAITTAAAQSTTDSPPSTDPRVMAALAAQKRLEEVMMARNLKEIESLMAPDLLVNAPINKVVNRDNVLGRIKAGQISYEPNVVRNIENASARGDTVVIMGEEIVHPTQDAPHAGKAVHRRFTDIWKQMDGGWKLWARQATITSVD